MLQIIIIIIHIIVFLVEKEHEHNKKQENQSLFYIHCNTFPHYGILVLQNESEIKN